MRGIWRTQEDPCHQAVSEVAIGGCGIAETENVQLLLSTSSCSVDRKQDRPRDATPNEADDDHQFEEAKVEEVVERIVLHSKTIGNRPIVGDPSEHARFRAGCPVMTADEGAETSRLVDSVDLRA